MLQKTLFQAKVSSYGISDCPALWMQGIKFSNPYLVSSPIPDPPSRPLIIIASSMLLSFASAIFCDEVSREEAGRALRF